jgi:hypothetical protein
VVALPLPLVARFWSIKQAPDELGVQGATLPKVIRLAAYPMVG